MTLIKNMFRSTKNMLIKAFAAILSSLNADSFDFKFLYKQEIFPNLVTVVFRIIHRNESFSSHFCRFLSSFGCPRTASMLVSSEFGNK